MDHYEIVNKLIGPIEPVGETNSDERRYENLEHTLNLVDQLMRDIRLVSQFSSRMEYSMSKAGKLATEFLEDVKANA